MRILAFAYACEPEKGSEPGIGWNFARMLARLGETWVITREDYRSSIEAALPQIPEKDSLHFIFVELPPRLRAWQQGLRGLRIYYFLWQYAALKEARRKQREMSFDVVWHLTWGNIWLGSMAALAGGRFVYGPVGGSVKTFWRMLPHLGLRGALFELTRSLGQNFGRYLNPLARIAWRRAELILVQNPETRDWLPRTHRAKVEIFPNAVAPDNVSSESSRSRDVPAAMYAGRLMPFKGVFLAMHAMTNLDSWRLLICGDGPDEQRLRKLASRLRILDRVEFLGWTARAEVLRVMREDASVFLYPAFRDDASVVVVEAVMSGLPVVGFDRGGVPILAGPAGTYVEVGSNPREVGNRLADAVRRSAAAGLSEEARQHVKGFDIEGRTEALASIVNQAMGLSLTPT